MASVTFKEFLAEGFHADLRAKLASMKKEIAGDLGERTYRIRIERRIDDVAGYVINIAVPIPKDHEDAQNFYEQMAVQATKKAFTKHFKKFRMDSTGNVAWDNGRAIWINATVPDFDGLM